MLSAGAEIAGDIVQKSRVGEHCREVDIVEAESDALEDKPVKDSHHEPEVSGASIRKIGALSTPSPGTG